MAPHDKPHAEITPDALLKAYACGIFPMAQSAHSKQLYWIEPEERGLLPLDRIHLPRRLRRTIRQHPFDIRINSDFEGVISGCAAEQPTRNSTWINDQIRSLYRTLHRHGHCHTVEAWQHDRLVGGLYGVALGGAFFGESMFSTRRDASKIALIYLCARLIHGGFQLLDTQFVTEHLRQFGTIEITRNEFQDRLAIALGAQGEFHRLALDTEPQRIIDIVLGAQKAQ